MFSVESILFKDANTTNNMVVNTQTSLKSSDEIYKDAAQAMEDLEFYNTYSKLSTYNNLQKLKMVKRLHSVTQNIRNKQANNSCESYLSNLAYSIEEDQKNGEENKGEETKDESSGKKDGNIIVRFFRWLKNMLKRFFNLLKSLWNKFIGFFKKEKENFNKEVKEEDKSPEVSEIKANPNESIFKELPENNKIKPKVLENYKHLKEEAEAIFDKFGGFYSLNITNDNIAISKTAKTITDAKTVVEKMKDNNAETLKTEISNVNENISQLEERINSFNEGNGSNLESAISTLFSKGKDKLQLKKVTDKNNLNPKTIDMIINDFNQSTIEKKMNDTMKSLQNVITLTDSFIDVCIKKVNDKDITKGKLTDEHVQKHNYSTDISKTDVNTANKGIIHSGLTSIKNIANRLTKLDGKYTSAVQVIISYCIKLKMFTKYNDELNKAGFFK